MEGKRILIIEDDGDSRWIFATVLRHAGYEVIEGTDGLEGLALASGSEPDLLVLDIMLPGMDGVALVRSLRAEPNTADLPVLAVSADPMRERGARDAGCDEFISKPVRREELVGRVAELLADHPRRARHRNGSSPVGVPDQP